MRIVMKTWTLATTTMQTMSIRVMNQQLCRCHLHCLREHRCDSDDNSNSNGNNNEMVMTRRHRIFDRYRRIFGCCCHRRPRLGGEHFKCRSLMILCIIFDASHPQRHLCCHRVILCVELCRANNNNIGSPSPRPTDGL